MNHHHRLSLNSTTRKMVNKAVKKPHLSFFLEPAWESNDQYTSLVERYRHVNEALLRSLREKKAQHKKKKSKRAGPKDWSASKKVEATPYHEHIEGTHWNKFSTVKIKAARKTKQSFNKANVPSFAKGAQYS